MSISVEIEEDLFWNKFYIDDVFLYFKGHVYSHTIDSILKTIKNASLKDVISFIKSLEGNFSIVIQKKDFVLMVVDTVCSTPLFFTKIESNFYINHNPTKLIQKNKFKKYIRDDSILELSMSGYVVGNKTIYRDLYSLRAGELVVFQNNNFKYIQYYKYFGEVKYKDYNEYIEELSEVTLNIFRKMLKEIGSKQIIIPLSAGNDSRLVASVLKYLGAKNVKCYSYGSVGNFEANIANIVAKKLGYEWMFIPLTHKDEKKFYKSSEYKDYLKFSETYCSVPFIQSLSTIKHLKEIGWVDDDAIFINGNSGDFISGAHINALVKDMNGSNDKEKRKENILNNLIKKHFSLWGYLKTGKNIEKIKNTLWCEIVTDNGELQEIGKDHIFYEYSELINRQSKYVVAGQKAYEFYNYKWMLPLWDCEYLHFWQKIPAEFKVNQQLYVDMLKKKNYGNVWGGDIPVNKKTITPIWIIPIRFLFKAPFALFGVKGRKLWRTFEVSVFYYWMDALHMVNITKYSIMIRSIFKKPRNHVSWQTEDYLKNLINE